MIRKVILSFLILCVLRRTYGSSTGLEKFDNCPMPGISMTNQESDENFSQKYSKVDTYKICGTFCSRTTGCQYWTWFSQAMYGFEAKDCLLFESEEQTNARTGAYSGEKNCPDPKEKPEPECPNCLPLPIEFSDHNVLDKIAFDDGQSSNFIESIQGIHEEDVCGNLCAVTTPCLYWTWYNYSTGGRDANTCLLFDDRALPELRYNSYARSGNKYYPQTNPEPGCRVCEFEGSSADRCHLMGLMKWVWISAFVVFNAIIKQQL